MAPFNTAYDPVKNGEIGQNTVPPESELISLAEAAKLTPYSQEYISLLARKGKFLAWKKGRNWFTTKNAIFDYVNQQTQEAKEEYENKAAFTPQVEPKVAPEILAAREIATALGETLGAKFDGITEELKQVTEKVSQVTQPPLPPTIEFAPALTPVQTHRPRHPILFYILILLIVFPLLFLGFTKGLADDAYGKFMSMLKNAWTLDGHKAGTNPNEVLILNEAGNISIKGHIETQGQLRSYARDGVAPIIVDSTTKIENLNADSVDGFSPEQFTLAFVTKNGNVTTDDVYLKGKVEIGQTLEVKGATRLLDALLVEGDLGVWGKTFLHNDLQVEGNVDLKQALNVGGDVKAGGNLSTTGSIKTGGGISAGGDIVTNNHNLVLGNGTITMNNTNLVKNLNAEMWNGLKATNLDLDFVTDNGATTTNKITIGGLAVNGDTKLDNNLSVYGDTNLYGQTTIQNLKELTVSGTSNLNKTNINDTLTVNAHALFRSANVSSILSATNLGVGNNASIGNTISDKMNVEASSTFNGPITAASTLTLTSATPAISTTVGNLILQSKGDSVTGNIQIGTGGTGSTTPDLLVLDTKSDAADPTGTAGAMYYNSISGKFRCYESGAWSDCVGAAGGASTLQGAYNSGNSITTTDARDITFNLADTTTDSNFGVNIADGSTSTVSITRADGVGTADPSQLLLLNNASITRSIADGLKITSALGLISDGLDVSNANLVNAINVGDNNIVGTTPLIDFTNFDVSASGNITVSPGQGIDTNATGILALGNTTATTVNIGGAAPTINIGPGSNTAASVNIVGGSGATGCTFDGATGNLICTGSISGSSTGDQGFWNRTGTVLSPTTTGDTVTTSGNIYTTGSGDITSAGDLTINGGNINFGAATTIGDGGDALTIDSNGTLTINDSTIAGSGALTLQAGGTNQNLALEASGSGQINIGSTSTGDVNLAGGSGATGCTVNNTTGDLNCTGNISGGSTGDQGFWNRTGTILSPKIAGDAITTSGNIYTSGSGTITSANDLAVNGTNLTTTQTTFNLLNTTATTLNIGGAATNVYLGAGTGTTIVNHAFTSTGLLTASNGISVSANKDITFVAGSGSLILNNTVSNASDNVIDITPNFTGGTNGLTYNTINIGAFSPANSTGTNTVNALNIGNLTDPGSSILSTAINIGTGWDTGLSLGANSIVGTTGIIDYTNFDVASTGHITVQPAYGLDTNAAGSLALGATNATTVDLAGGSGSTGCTITNSSGNLTCTGDITSSSGGTVGYWSRSGTILSPVTAGDTITTSGNIYTSSTGTITSAGLLTASNGLTQTTGALNLTATSGALTLSGLGTSSINTGINDITFTSANFNTTSTGINSTAIGATTASTGAFTTLGSTGVTNFGNGSTTVAINSSSWDITSAGTASGFTGLTSTGNINLTGAQILGASPLVFEGATDNDITTTFAFTDPTTSNKTITFPNASGTVAVSASSPISLSVLGDISCSTCLVTSGSLFTITDGLTPQTINQGDTLTLVDGTDINVVTSATDTITINNTSTLASVAGRGATTTTLVNLDGGIAVDTSNFTVSGTTGDITSAGDLTINGGNINFGAATTIGDGGDALTIDSNGTLTINDSTIAGSGALTLQAGGTNQNLVLEASGSGQINIGSTSTGDVNLAGGSGATGCTVNNTTGDLTCTGSINGGTSGNIGYWNRTGTTLSPATANDIIAVIGNTGDLLTLTSSATGSANKALNISQTGATTGTDYGAYISNTGAGTTNVGLYATASGATNNYAAIFDNGNVGIGDTTPAATLTVGNGDLFQVAGATGNITVQAGYGLDTTAAGILALGNTTATTVNIGTTATTTLNLGATGALTRAINIGTGTGADTINIGTGSTGADQITIGQAAANISLTDAQWSITGAGLITTADDVAVNGGDLTTTATTFNLVNANATTVNLAGASTTLNLAGGSSDGGCTIDGLGNMTCTGSINGGTSGNIGYWNRTGTTLSPATANDIIAVTGNTGDLLTLTSSATGASNKTLNISQTGATVGTDYGAYISNTGAATTNIGLYATASGATNNYAAIFDGGQVGIGTTTPTAGTKVDIVSGSSDTTSLNITNTHVGEDTIYGIQSTVNLNDGNALTQNQYGGYFRATGTGSLYGSYGVYGLSDVTSYDGESAGVKGEATESGIGVYGLSADGIGMLGQSTNNIGVYGQSSSSYGLYGYSGSSYALYALGTSYLTGNVTANSDLAVNGGDLTTTSGTFNLLNAATTLNIGSTNITRTINIGTGTGADTINIGTGATTADTINIGNPGAVATSIVMAGGSDDTGCTVAGATGNLTCSGNITGSSSGTVGFWSRSGTTLQPATSGDNLTILGAGAFTTGTGTTTVNSTAWTFASDTNFTLSGGVNGLSFDTNTLSIDATNDRVGIGTTSPEEKLHVAGALKLDNGASNTNLLTNSSFNMGIGNGWSIYANSGNGASATYTTDATTYISYPYSGKVTVTNGGSASSDVQFWNLPGSYKFTNGRWYTYSFWAKVSSGTYNVTGYFGMATTPYTNYGTINYTLTTTWQRFSKTFQFTGTDSDSQRIDFFFGGSSASGLDFYIDNVTVSPGVLSPESQPMTIWDDGTVIMEGSVGIGDTTPDAKLDIESTGAVTTVAGATALSISNLTTNTTTALTKYGAYLTSTGTFDGGANITNNYGLYVDTVSGADNNYGAYFANNVGIGDTTPAATLTVGDGDLFQVAGATGNITTAGDLAVNGGDLTTTQTTFNLLNTTATTLNIGGSATTISLGAGTGTTIVNHAFTSTGLLTASNGISVSANKDITFVAGSGSLILNNTVSNASDNVIDITPNFTGGTNGLTYNTINIGAFSPANSTGTNTVNALNIGNLTDPGSSILSTAINIGTGWDTGLSLGANSIVGTTGIIDYTNFDVASTGNITVQPAYGLDINAAGSMALGATNATTVDLAGGSGSTGCTVTNSNGNLTCTGDITSSTGGTVGYWSRSGTTLQPATSGDNLTILGAGALTTGTGTTTVNSTAWTFASDTNFTLSGGVNGLSFDTNTLSIDATNDRVGIGTTSPQYPLQVFLSGSGIKDILSLNNTSGTAGSAARMIFQLVHGGEGGGSDTYSVAGIAGSIPNTASFDDYFGDLAFYTTPRYGSLTQSMILNGTGSLGINGFTKLSMLTVKGKTVSSISVFVVISNSSTTVTGSYTNFTLYAGIGDKITVNGETRTITAIASDTSLTVDSVFSTSGSFTGATIQKSLFRLDDSSDNTKLIVNDQGNVGIGDTTPATTLTVGNGDLFQVAGATGNITTAGDLAVNGNDITATGALSVTGATGLTLTATTGNATLDTVAAAATLTIGSTNATRTINIGSVASAQTINIAGTGATAADTINIGTGATTADTINIGNPGAVAATINIAGGSGDTGCTVAGATGNLTCSGNITGSSSGTVGFWSRSGTTLQPATSGDNLTILGAGAFTTGTGTTTVNSTAWTFASDTNFTLSGGVNGLSFDTNTLSIDATNDRVGIGTVAPSAKLHISLIAEQASPVTYTASSANEGFLTNSYINSGDGWTRYTDIVALGNKDNTYGGSVIRFLTNSQTSFTATESMRIDRIGNVGIGDTTPDALLEVESSAVTGGNFLVTNTGIVTNGNVASVVVNSLTTGTGFSVSTNALTTGIGVNVASSATAITGAGRMLYSNHTGATGTSAILNEFASAANDETTIFKVTASAALAGGIVQDLSAAALTTGKVIDISDLNAITTGKALHIDATGVTQTDGILVHVDSASTALTSTGRLLLIDHTGNAGVSNINSEFKSAAADETEIVKITASAALAAGKMLNLSGAAMTTGTAINAGDLNTLTTGIGVNVASSATAITGAGRMLYSNHTGATGTSAILNEFASAANDETTIFKVTASAALAGGKMLNLSGASMTTGTGIYASAPALTTGKLVDLQVSGTAAGASQTALNILTTGANANAGITTYGAYISNTHSTNTSTNVGLYVNASGGATNNYAAIFDGGNVGIGTVAPGYQVHVQAPGTTWQWGGMFMSPVTESSADYNVLGGNGGGGFRFYGTGNGKPYGTAQLDLGADSTINMLVGSGSVLPTSALYINSSRNIGIGTTAPASKLDVTTTALGVTQTNTSGLALVNTTAAAAGAQQISPALRWRGFGWKTDATAASQPVDFRTFVRPIQGTAAPTGGLDFQSAINDGTYANLLTILSSGNVGIGTTGPSFPLQIQKDNIGSTYTSSGLAVVNSTAATSGQQQNASVKLTGQTWSGGASTNADWWIVGDAMTNGNQTFRIYTSKGGGAATQILSIDSSGQFGTAFKYNSWDNREVLNLGGQRGNDAAATVSYDQYSPYNKYHSNGWKTGGTPGSQTMSLGYMNAPEQGVTNPVGVHKVFYGTNTSTPVEANELYRLEWGDRLGFIVNQPKTAGFATSIFGSVNVELGSTASTTAVCSSLANTTAPTAGVAYELRDCSSTPASDYMEIYSVIQDVEMGDVLMPGSSYITTTSGDRLVSLVKATDASKVLGIASNPADAGDFNSIGYNIKPEDNPKPVALAGRVKIKVSNENGAIVVGDHLVLSSIPGVVKKATKAGMSVGVALEDYNRQGVGLIMAFVNRSQYDPVAGEYLSISGGEVAGMVKVTAAGTPLVIDLIGQTNINAPRNIFETRLNGEVKFAVTETGDATLVGKLTAGSLSTLADATVGGTLKLAGNLETGDLVRLDKNGNLQNITSIKVTASVNADGTVTAGSIPATSIGAAISVAQTATDPVTATRAALALSTVGQTSLDYLVWSDSFQVTFDGRVLSKTIEAKESLVVGTDNLLAGTLVAGKVGDTFSGDLIKFTNTAGKKLFTVSGSGLLEADTIKTRALVIDNTDEPRATIGSAIIPTGSTTVTITAPEVKPGMKIFLTPKLAISQSLAVTDIQAGSFTVSLAFASASDVPFDWWLVDVTNPNLVAAVSSTTTVSTPPDSTSGTSTSTTDSTTESTSTTDTTTSDTSSGTTASDSTTSTSDTASTSTATTSTTTDSTTTSTSTTDTTSAGTTSTITTTTSTDSTSTPTTSVSNTISTTPADGGTVSASAVTP